MPGRSRRLALLAEGRFTPFEAKTAVGMLRYRPDQVGAVIDSTRAGSTAAECVGVGGAIPVVADVPAAEAAGADGLAIGIAPQGGGLPDSWRATLCQALERGWDVHSGLHVFLADDPELAAAAARRGGRIFDLRRPPAQRTVAAARASELDALVVLTVGSDCNVGKMTAALELTRELERRGTRATFVATGQTGILIAGRGVIRTAEGAPRELPIPPLAELRRAYEAAAAWVHPARVVGVALNTLDLDEPAARGACESAARELALPVTDPVRFGARSLADAVLALAGSTKGRTHAPHA